MVDMQTAAQGAAQIAQAVQQAQPVISWQINIVDLMAVGVSAGALYARLVKVEVEIRPIVNWWNKVLEVQHELGRRWTDHVESPIPDPPKHGNGRHRS